MADKKVIYRGFDIEPRDGGYTVFKDGVVQTSQPSLEFAQSWVDKEKRKQAERA